MSRYLEAERFEMLLVRPCFQMNPKTTKLFIVISFYLSSPEKSAVPLGAC